MKRAFLKRSFLSSYDEHEKGLFQKGLYLSSYDVDKKISSKYSLVSK
jgi:hypothetical protein